MCEAGKRFRVKKEKRIKNVKNNIFIIPITEKVKGEQNELKQSFNHWQPGP